MHEKSIKVLGPRAWSSIPNEAKLLPFRKSFSNHIKKKFISALPDKESKTKKFDPTTKTETIEKDNLHHLFSEVSLDEEFLGFDLDLNTIFHSDSDSDEEFHGFGNPNSVSIFISDLDSEEEFYGF